MPSIRKSNVFAGYLVTLNQLKMLFSNNDKNESVVNRRG